MTRFPHFAAVAALGAVLTAAMAAVAQKPPKPPATGVANAAIPVLPIAIAVAQDGEKPVRDDAWIAAQLAESNRLFGAFGVAFRVTATRPLPGRFARLESRDDRDDLAKELQPGVVNVFVVASLRDVDDPSRLRMGVHWHKRADVRKHYVIVAADARESTLAHELGHFFGNGHSKVVDNLMSYERSGAAVFLDKAQRKKIRAFAGMFLRAKELVPVSDSPS